jgi:hypothetical protein
MDYFTIHIVNAPFKDIQNPINIFLTLGTLLMFLLTRDHQSLTLRIRD